MFEDVLVEQNPHWSGHIYESGIQRDAFKQLLKYLEVPHVISLVGVRRAGKSTILKQLINYLQEDQKTPAHNIFFLNLEHPYFLEYASDIKYLEKIFEDYLKIALPKGKIYCLLDEVQFFQNWPVFIKAHYEQKNIKFIITGSNSQLLSSDLLTLLSGRTLPIEIFPLSFKEIILNAKIDSNDSIALSKNRHLLRNLLDQYLSYGGFPEVALLSNKDTAFDILNAYSKTIIYQDVAKRLQLKKPLDLEKLFYYLISNISAPFSYNKLSKLFDLTDKTIKEYIQALEDSFLLFQLEAFSFSIKQQIRSPKKIYSIDLGLINSVAFRFSENIGKLLENAVFLKLKRESHPLYYYKTVSGYEIDFVIQNGKVIELVQVSKELSFQKTKEREVRALVEGLKELDLKEGRIISFEDAEEIHVDGITIQVIPIYKFLLGN